MDRFQRLCVAISVVFLGLQPALAEPTPVLLEPVRHQAATLTVKTPEGGETVYTPADLEALPTYEMTTTTPWRDNPARFAGVLLTDLLGRHGLSDVDAIAVVAENDFEMVFTREAIETAPILIATRVDGKPHSRRSRGPIQFVIADEDMRNHDIFLEGHLVWMANVIRVAD